MNECSIMHQRTDSSQTLFICQNILAVLLVRQPVHGQSIISLSILIWSWTEGDLVVAVATAVENPGGAGVAGVGTVGVSAPDRVAGAGGEVHGQVKPVHHRHVVVVEVPGVLRDDGELGQRRRWLAGELAAQLARAVPGHAAPALGVVEDAARARPDPHAGGAGGHGELPREAGVELDAAAHRDRGRPHPERAVVDDEHVGRACAGCGEATRSTAKRTVEVVAWDAAIAACCLRVQWLSAETCAMVVVRGERNGVCGCIYRGE
jgi:hypothetical protein